MELQTVDAVHRAMGRPSARRPTVHLVGTNGKGSTAMMLEHALRRRGWRTGLFTSPHLHRRTERIRIDGVAIDPGVLDAEIEGVLEHERGVDRPRALSFFELLTLAALARFEREGLGALIVEAGLGGGRDATRIVTASAVGITSIGLDHRQVIGPNLDDIAREKAGAMAPGVPTFSAPQDPIVAEVLRAHAAEQSSPLRFVEPWPNPPSGVLGDHQRINAAVALAVGEVLDPGLTEADLDAAVLPGRLERRPWEGGTLWIDAAHNPPGIRAVVEAIEAGHASRPSAVLFGCHADKDRRTMLDSLASLGCPIAWVPVGLGAPDEGPAFPSTPSFTGLDDPRLRLWLRAQLDGGDTVLCCGSFLVAGTVRAWSVGDEAPPDPQDPRPPGHHPTRSTS